MFVVRINFITNEATHNKQTEKKTLGRRTVASTAVYSMPRMELVRSDLPSFFNQNLFRMRTKKDENDLSVLRKDWSVAELKVSYRQKKKTGVKITSSLDAANVFHKMWDKSLLNVQEQLCALFLNQAHEVIGFRIISTGKLTSNTVDVQLLLSCALISRCATMMIAHNHPSGNPNHSEADELLTWHIKKLSEQFDFRLLDHLIITDSSYTSFADNGIIFKAD